MSQKRSSSRSYLIDGYVYHEYDRQVDFRISAARPNWRILTFVPVKDGTRFMMDMVDKKILNAMHMDERILRDFNTAGIYFKPKRLDAKENTEARRHLLRYLDNKKYRIVWKEDLHGYCINMSGHIYRKWALDKGKPKFCPLAERVRRPLPLAPIKMSDLPLIPDSIVPFSQL